MPRKLRGNVQKCSHCGKTVTNNTNGWGAHYAHSPKCHEAEMQVQKNEC